MTYKNGIYRQCEVNIGDHNKPMAYGDALIGDTKAITCNGSKLTTFELRTKNKK